MAGSSSSGPEVFGRPNPYPSSMTAPGMAEATRQSRLQRPHPSATNELAERNHLDRPVREQRRSRTGLCLMLREVCAHDPSSRRGTKAAGYSGLQTRGVLGLDSHPRASRPCGLEWNQTESAYSQRAELKQREVAPVCRCFESAGRNRGPDPQALEVLPCCHQSAWSPIAASALPCSTV